jgi:hypothetical protein
VHAPSPNSRSQALPACHPTAEAMAGVLNPASLGPNPRIKGGFFAKDDKINYYDAELTEETDSLELSTARRGNAPAVDAAASNSRPTPTRDTNCRRGRIPWTIATTLGHAPKQNLPHRGSSLAVVLSLSSRVTTAKGECDWSGVPGAGNKEGERGLERRARLALCAGGSVSDGIPELPQRPAIIGRGG